MIKKQLKMRWRKGFKSVYVIFRKMYALFNNELINMKNSWTDHINVGQQYTRITS